MMSNWPRWQLDGEELTLTRYVHPEEVARLAQLPGRSGESRIVRLHAVYDALAARQVGYAYEALSDEAGRQEIRPPDQVLWAPKHGTCLDLVLVLAAGCLKAGLHPIVVVLDPPDSAGPLHVVLLVRLDSDIEPGADLALWRQQPDGLVHQLQRDLSGPARLYVAIDPVGLAGSLGTTQTRGLAAGFAAAIVNGARYLVGDDDEPAWQWRLGIDVGRAWRAQDVLPIGTYPLNEPLREPYRRPDTAESPLRLLRAEYELVPFQNRDELTVLRDWCHQIAAGATTGLAVITGLGGSGKTRLALELAHRMRAEGWYAGVLPKGIDGIDWLAGVVSPVLVVLDYADGRAMDAIALLAALQARQGPPAVVLLTARSREGDWLPDIENALVNMRHPYRIETIPLPDTHPDALDVYRRTISALTQEAVKPPIPPQGIRWTTLDFVLLGWVAVHGTTELPHTSGALYDQALVHEVDYWCTVHSTDAPERTLLRKAAACVSLVAPDEAQAYHVLKALDELADDAAERRAVRRTLTTCLSPDVGEGLAVRPDAVGDHLLLTELSRDHALLARTLELAGEPKLTQVVTVLTRAGQNDPVRAVSLITTMLEADPGRWPPVLSVALTQHGAAAASLLDVAIHQDSPLPLAEISQRIPKSSTGLFELGLAIDTRRLDDARSVDASQSELAELLVQVAVRAMAAGDLINALNSVREAVQYYRELASSDPQEHLVNLASSLGNLSNCQRENGDSIAAVSSGIEAVDTYKRLIKTRPEPHLADYARSLNNLSAGQSLIGDHAGAINSVTEAVAIYRQLVTEQPETPTHDLAMSLSNLSGCQLDSGDRTGALESITEAITYFRQLAAVDVAEFLPYLAVALNNISGVQAGIGHKAEALASAVEAVGIHRWLEEINSQAFRGRLAAFLNTLSNRQGDIGDWTGALNSAAEAVKLHRQLAINNPEAFLPGLAKSLSNLSGRQGDLRYLNDALASSIEATDLYRQLAAVSPKVFIAELAMSLNNLSVHQSNLGHLDEALASSAESVAFYRQVAAASGDSLRQHFALALGNLSARQAESGDGAGALASIIESIEIHRLLASGAETFLGGLAGALNDFASRQSDSGDRVGALASMTEALEIRRRLAEEHAAAFLPDLAFSLRNMSVHQSKNGDRVNSLASVAEAVGIYRRLVAENRGQFLHHLAKSIDTSATCQGEMEDWAGALASSIEAVNIYREIAATQTLAFLPDLATSLHNLSNWQGRVGDKTGALEAIAEAVDIRRRLVIANSDTTFASLAESLISLATLLGGTGDPVRALATAQEATQILRKLTGVNRDAFIDRLALAMLTLSDQYEALEDHASALDAIMEAVAHYRELSVTHPSAFRPNLAAALNNLSMYQVKAGDKAGAIDSITESIKISRDLAAGNPAAFYSTLTTSLQNLSDQQNNSTDDSTQVEWLRSIEAMPFSAARAAIRAVWAQRLAKVGNESGSKEQLMQAAHEAEELPWDRASLVMTMRARHIVRACTSSYADDSAPDLPSWATTPLPEEHVAVVNTFARSNDWPAKQKVLSRHAGLVQTSGFQSTVKALRDLYLDNPTPKFLDEFLQEAEGSTLGELLKHYQSDYERRLQLNTWLSIPSIVESFRFLQDNFARLTDPAIRKLLEQYDPAISRQRSAILQLASSLPLPQVQAIVANPSMAEDAAFDAIESGNLDDMTAIAFASGRLEERPAIAALVAILTLLGSGRPDDARDLAHQVAEHATDIQRRAHIVRLTALQQQRPGFVLIDDIIAILRP